MVGLHFQQPRRKQASKQSICWDGFYLVGKKKKYKKNSYNGNIGTEEQFEHFPVHLKSFYSVLLSKTLHCRQFFMKLYHLYED